LILGIAEEGTT